MNEMILAADWNRLGPTFQTAIIDTLLMVIITMVVAGLLGLVVGLLLYTTRAGGILKNKVIYTILNVLVNFVRPIPFIILIAAIKPLTVAVMGTSIGRDAGIFVMVVAAMSAMVGYIGGGGLGDFAIVYGYRAFDNEVMYVAVLVIVIIVQAAQLLGNWLSKKIMRR